MRDRETRRKREVEGDKGRAGERGGEERGTLTGGSCMWEYAITFTIMPWSIVHMC